MPPLEAMKIISFSDVNLATAHTISDLTQAYLWTDSWLLVPVKTGALPEACPRDYNLRHHLEKCQPSERL